MAGRYDAVIMNALFDAYYYGVENGEVQGPLPLETIGAKVNSGDVPEWVMLSRTSGGPWAPLGLVRRLGEAAFAPPAKAIPEPMAKPGHAPAAAKPAKSPARAAGPVEMNQSVRQTQRKNPWSVGGFVEVLGVLFMMGAILSFISMVWLLFVKGDPRGAASAIAAAWLVGCGLWLLVVAEVLKRLLSISESVRLMAERKE